MTEEIFVVGNSRTGTHLVSLLLNAGRECFMFSELHYWEQVATRVERIDREAAIRQCARLMAVHRQGVFASHDPRPFMAEARALTGTLQAPITNVAVYKAFLHHETRQNGKAIPIEQTPRNLFYVRDLAQELPGARFIAMQRDPRDVLLSQRAKWKMRWSGYGNIPTREALRTWANFHPVTVSLLWRASAREILTLSNELPPERLRIIKFEDLVEAPRAVLRDLCGWLDIGFEEAMLDIPRWGSSHEPKTDDARGIDSRAANRWSGKAKVGGDTALCEWICRREMRRFNYHLVARSGPPVVGGLISLVTLVPKTVLAMVLNVRRFRSIRQSIGRRFRQGRAWRDQGSSGARVEH